MLAHQLIIAICFSLHQIHGTKIERYDPLSDPNNNHRNKQPRVIKPPIFSVEPSSTTNNNNNNNNNAEPSPKPLQPHFCEQIELIIKNADRAVFLPRREEIVRAFMKNPKDINYEKNKPHGSIFTISLPNER